MLMRAGSRTGAKGLVGIAALLAAFSCGPDRALADEGGVSFWLPGLYGSLAAAPQQPGLSAASIYYHTSVSAGGQVSAAREVTIGKLRPTASVNLNANLNADVDLALLNATYVFAAPVLGGQFALGLMGIYGHNKTSVDGTLTAMLGPLVATRSGTIDSSLYGFGDLYPSASLRWNQGVNNFMVYATGDIPVGAYDSTRLANLGIGHGAVDGGFGYTYFNPQAGHEFSVVTGLTYNLKNDATDYQNGIDWHLDWGASQFLSKQFFIGAVGYFYNQLTADKGSLQILGDVRSRVVGVGPQIGFIFPAGAYQGFLGVKSYFEFDAADRPEGWNAWVTLAFSPAAQQAGH
jgi:hypothetical protein